MSAPTPPTRSTMRTPFGLTITTLAGGAALLGAVSFTVFAALRLRGTGFGELMPDALRPRSLQAAPPLDSDREPDGDIAGYRPLSADELRSL